MRVVFDVFSPVVCAFFTSSLFSREKREGTSEREKNASSYSNHRNNEYKVQHHLP